MADQIINRVANSPLITIDLEETLPELMVLEWDVKDVLFKGLILREKDFRGFVKEHDWSKYKNQLVALYCSADAIVPTWAYMILANKLEQNGAQVIFGTKAEVLARKYKDMIEEMDLEIYRDKMIVVKGCGDRDIPTDVYVQLTARLTPLVKSIMYGEPCSTVPVYKKPKKA
jgi:fructose-1-phosphate kinase PfkB-like protein